MKAFWDERYEREEYVYGKEPNAFLKEQLARIPAGKALFPAEGEGRNAVYAASLGWEVTAFDYSEAARKKAEALAAEQGVQIEYHQKDIYQYHFPEAAFGLIGLFFAHLPPDDRRYLHRQAAGSLKTGGRIVLEAFSKAQLGRSSGGPKKEDMLFSPEELREDFSGLHIEYLEELETQLSEGAHHSGTANVIRMVAIRS